MIKTTFFSLPVDVDIIVGFVVPVECCEITKTEVFQNILSNSAQFFSIISLALR